MAGVIHPRPPSDPEEPAGRRPCPSSSIRTGCTGPPSWPTPDSGRWHAWLPALIREAISLAWATSRRDTAASLGLNVAAGVLTTLGLLATTGVLHQLFAAGPTPDRIRAALPALTLAAAAVAGRGALTIAAGWAQARLVPQINFPVERRLFETTSAVELAAFDDAGFAEEMDRARDRGLVEAGSWSTTRSTWSPAWSA
ncbi:hypothetical protein V2I01_34730 [Micromonospora sp. BRA006-A]|nr:hypothetical protein [Micromonospora sp. BRA006-A]